MIITSKDNETIKYIRKLKEKKYRDEFGEFIIEGSKIIEEALNEKENIKIIVICDNCANQIEIEQTLMYEIAKQKCIYVDEKVFLTISDVQNPQGILAVVAKKNIEEKINFEDDIIIALDDIQDPGNIGTIIRTVDSVGLKQIILSKKSADVYNSKVVRATMGAIFRVNFIETNNLVETLKEIKKHKFTISATSLNTDNSLYDLKLKKTVIVVGNEANGVSKDVLNISDEKIKIPMLGKTESLNVAVATGVILYEYVRRKTKK